MKYIVAFALASSTTLSLAAGDLARGEYLVETVMACGNCHTPMGPQGPLKEQALSGRLVEKTPMFTAIAPNITPAGPLKDWSDAELKRAIREGIRPDGSVIGPPMPFSAYRGIADADLDSIVLYLRQIPAVEGDPGLSEYKMPLPPAYGPPIASVAMPDENDVIAYGEYLAFNLGHCLECHSPMSERGPDVWNRLGEGGMEFKGPWGVVVAPKLTNTDDGLARYSDPEILKMITSGQRPDGSQMLPPMPYGNFSQVDSTDLEAIVKYLRTL